MIIVDCSVDFSTSVSVVIAMSIANNVTQSYEGKLEGWSEEIGSKKNNVEIKSKQTKTTFC